MAGAEFLPCIFPCYFCNREQSSIWPKARGMKIRDPQFGPILGVPVPQMETATENARDFPRFSNLHAQFAGRRGRKSPDRRSFSGIVLDAVVQMRMVGAVRSLIVTLLRTHRIYKEHFFEDCAPRFPVYQGKYREYLGSEERKRHPARKLSRKSKRLRGNSPREVTGNFFDGTEEYPWHIRERHRLNRQASRHSRSDVEVATNGVRKMSDYEW